MEGNIFNKNTILDYLWQYSRFYYIRLHECEMLYLDDMGYAATTLLFSSLENIIKSVANDYDSSFQEVTNKLKENSIITESEFEFINNNKFSIRKIRNLFAHSNLMAINLINCEDGREILYPLSEEESCLLLYEKTSLIIFNLVLKIISTNFIDTVKNEISIDLSNTMSNCNLEFKILSTEEMLELKGLPKDYFDDIDIPEDTKIRLIDNAQDVNVLQHIFKNLLL